MANKPQFVAESAFLCEQAFFDAFHRLCANGIMRLVALPKLNVALTQITVAVILKERPLSQKQVNLNLDIVTPSGQHCNPQDPSALTIQADADFIIVTLREMPIHEEGIYTFNLRIDGQMLAAVPMPVSVPPAAAGLAH